MNRRDFLKTGVMGTAPIMAGLAVAAPLDQASAKDRPFRIKPFELEEAVIPKLQAAMESGKESATSITKKYLARIAEIDQRGPTLRAVIEINPDALRIARALDQERKTHGPRGPLHGIPVLIKDNLDTHDRMMTTAGSLALLGSM